MLRRVGFFLIVNLFMMVTIGILVRLTGAEYYLNSAGTNYIPVMIFCALWGFGGAFISLLLSKTMAKTMMGVRIIDSQTMNSSERSLLELVRRMSKQAQLPAMPEVGIYDSPEVNAFATGPSRSNSLVAVSTGLLRAMDKESVEGVIGHEIAHIANGDMVTMTLIQGVVNAFVLFFARILGSIIDSALRGDRDERSGPGFGYFMTVWVLEIVLGFLGMIVVSYFSRSREFRADAGGAKVAGKSQMISALRSLQRMQKLNMSPEIEAAPAFATMKISRSRGGFLNLISTHPSLEERIARLQP